MLPGQEKTQVNDKRKGVDDDAYIVKGAVVGSQPELKKKARQHDCCQGINEPFLGHDHSELKDKDGQKEEELVYRNVGLVG